MPRKAIVPLCSFCGNPATVAKKGVVVDNLTECCGLSFHENSCYDSHVNEEHNG